MTKTAKDRYEIYKYDCVPFGWTKIANPGKKFIVSVVGN